MTEESINTVLMRALALEYYCEEREAFLRRCHWLCNYLGLITATFAAVMWLQGYLDYATWATFTAFAIFAPNLVVDMSDGARVYLDVRQEVAMVIDECHAGNEDRQAYLHHRLITAATKLPPTYHAVEALAYNVAQRYADRPHETLFVVPWWARILRNVCRFSPTFQTVGELRERPGFFHRLFCRIP